MLDEFYTLLPFIFKTQNRVNSNFFKKEKYGYLKKNNIEKYFLKYEHIFKDIETLSLFLYEYCIQPLPKVKINNKCLECGENTKLLSFKKGFSDFCSVKCSAKSLITQQKYKNTCLQKYGAINAMYNDEIKTRHYEAMDKIPFEQKQRHFKMFHKKLNENPLLKENHYKNVSSKIKQTLAHNPEIRKRGRNKYKQKYQEKYGVDNSSQVHITHFTDLNETYWRKHFIKDGIFLKEEAKKYHNVKDNAIYSYKRKFNIIEPCFPFSNNRSKAEIEILETLREKYSFYRFENNVKDLIKNPDTQRFLELDIVVYYKDKILCAVEYNGLYYHNKENPIRENLKTQLCKELNFELFHIWEDNEDEDLQVVFEYLDNLNYKN